MLKELVQFFIGQGFAVEAHKEIPEHIRLVPDGYNFESLEKHLPHRARFRTQIETKVIDDFVNITLEKKDDAECFIDPDKMFAKSIFNLGTKDEPGHGDHWAKLNMEKTVEYTEVHSVDGRQKNQADMAEWLEDWVEFLTPVYDDEVKRDMKLAIKSIRNVKIEAGKTSTSSVQTFAAEQSDVEKIRASGAEHPLPEGFIFRCVSYHGLKEIDIPLRLSMMTGGREPNFKLRIVKAEAISQKIIEEFKDLMVEKLEGVRVVLGTVGIN